MPIPSLTMRASLVGHLPQGEIFNTSFWLDGHVAPITAATTQAVADLVRNKFQLHAMGSWQSMLSDGGGYDMVRVYAYYGTAPGADFVAEAPITGGGGFNTGSMLPLQTCIVGTLITALAGRSYRGRMYLPCINAVVTEHQLSLTKLNSVSDAFAAMFTAINTDANPCRVVVLSQKPPDGETHAVTAVSVDSRFDIQRSRANRQSTSARVSDVVAGG